LIPLSSRALFALGALVCAGLLGTGYYLQYFQGQEPCPLCHVQRGFYYAVGTVCLITALHGPGRIGEVLYGALGLFFALGGGGVAAWHVRLIHLPPDKAPGCGPDLFFMLENLPLGRTVEKLFTGSGQCAEVKWRFLGLAIPEWSLVWFVLLSAGVAWLIFRNVRAERQAA